MPLPARLRRLRAVGGDRGEVALQQIGIDLQQLTGRLARTPRQGLVGQQRPQQMAGADARRALFERGQQPGLLAEFHDVRRQRRRARVAGLQLLQRAVQIGDEAPLVDLVMAQDGGDVAIGRIGQRQQPVFDLDIVMRARQRQAGRRLERATARLVQPADKLFQIDRGHSDFPRGKSPFSRSETMCYAEPLSSN